MVIIKYFHIVYGQSNLWWSRQRQKPNKISGLNKNVGNILVSLRVDATRSHRHRHSPESLPVKIAAIIKINIIYYIMKIYPRTRYTTAHLPQTVPRQLSSLTTHSTIYSFHSIPGPMPYQVPIMCRPVALLADSRFPIANFNLITSEYNARSILHHFRCQLAI